MPFKVADEARIRPDALAERPVMATQYRQLLIEKRIAHLRATCELTDDERAELALLEDALRHRTNLENERAANVKHASAQTGFDADL